MAHGHLVLGVPPSHHLCILWLPYQGDFGHGWKSGCWDPGARFWIMLNHASSESCPLENKARLSRTYFALVRTGHPAAWGPHQREITPLDWDRRRVVKHGNLQWSISLFHFVPFKTNRKGVPKQKDTPIYRCLRTFKWGCSNRAARLAHAVASLQAKVTA